MDLQPVAQWMTSQQLGEGPLRHTGEYEIMAHFAADVETPVKVIVEAEEA